MIRIKIFIKPNKKHYLLNRAMVNSGRIEFDLKIIFCREKVFHLLFFVKYYLGLLQTIFELL